MPGKYYVTHVSDPPATYGPYPLTTAKQYARIGAKPGYDDRIVTRGKSGPIVRIYHNEERIWPILKGQLVNLTKGEYPSVLRNSGRSKRSKIKSAKNPNRKTKQSRIRVDLWLMGSTAKAALAVDPSSIGIRNHYIEKLKSKGKRITAHQPIVRASTFDTKNKIARHLNLTPSELGQIQSGITVTKLISKTFLDRIAGKN